MTDDLEARLELWMRDVPVSDERLRQLSTIDLPPRRRPLGARLRYLTTVAAAGLLVLIASFGLARLPIGAGDAPRPPDPASFAGDPRMDRCGASRPGQALAAFEMAHASDYQIHLPAMGRSPELERAEPAFVVVFAGRAPFGGVSGGAAPQPGATLGPRTPAPNEHDVCVLVGDDPNNAELNVYTDVDTTGLRADTAP